MNDSVLVTNIQRFSLKDGPGIRTSVFLKGCTLNCPWCCNPENISSSIQSYKVNGYLNTYGIYMNSEALLEILLRDIFFYKNYDVREINSCVEYNRMAGGVTFTGGEPLIQIHSLEKTLQELKNKSISIVFETSLYVPERNVRKAINYGTLFYIDLKYSENKKVGEYLNGNFDIYLRNLQLVLSSNVPFILRIPVIGGYTDDIGTVKENIHFVNQTVKQKSKLLRVELLIGHALGNEKYKSLGKRIPSISKVDNTIINYYLDEICDIGISASVCKI